jgi:hypothetical protein
VNPCPSAEDTRVEIISMAQTATIPPTKIASRSSLPSTPTSAAAIPSPSVASPTISIAFPNADRMPRPHAAKLRTNPTIPTVAIPRGSWMKGISPRTR